MVGLCGIWGGLSNRRYDTQKSSIRTHYVSSYELRRADVSSESSLEVSDKFTRRRSPSLPPIFKQNYQEESNCDVEEGETSGYASDSGEKQDDQSSWPHRPRSDTQQPNGSNWQSFNSLNTPDSLNSESGRLRWGDKGVGVGHLWEASLLNPEARLPAVTDRPGTTPPAWLCRATDNTVSEVLVITHPEATSPITEFGSCDAAGNCDRTYLRGQNVLIEPEELLERERKRQKAKELQNAIRQQLEEREHKRKEERERRQKEETLEEERLRKQQEIERKRLEEERLKQKEKEVKQKIKEKAMKEAIEKAERLAREEKSKIRKKQKLEANECDASLTEEKYKATCIVGSELKIARLEIEQPKLKEKLTNELRPVVNTINENIKNLEINSSQTDNIYSKVDVMEEYIGSSKTISHSQPVKTQFHSPATKVENSESSTDQDVEPDSLDDDMNPDIALVMSTPQEVEVNQLSLIVSPGRLLTPSKFRTNISFEKSTQTDLTKSERSNKLPLRSRSQQRLEDRPKWGVNRPEFQYIKQSDRDPYHQTKVRRNLLRVRSKNQPDREDSRSPSPVNMKVQRSQASVTTVTRGTVTPRVMHMVLPSYSSSRSARPRYLSFRDGVGTVVTNNMFKQKQESSFQSPPGMELVKDVLNQLTSLRQGLAMKQKEWDISRSHTPFSEVSTLSSSA